MSTVEPALEVAGAIAAGPLLGAEAVALVVGVEHSLLLANPGRVIKPSPENKHTANPFI